MSENGIETRFLGSCGLRVPVLTLGTMGFGGVGRQAAVGSVQLAEATSMVGMCLERGMNFFDTADGYSAGLSEEILGEALRGRRGEALVATKVSAPMGQGPNDRGLSRHHIVRACEASLRRLGTDYIDLYQAHNVDEWTPMDETLGALDDLVTSGKVRYIGCSNYSAWHLMKALSASERRGLAPYVSLQAHYSLTARELEHELLAACIDQGVGVLVWSPLAGGFLAGRQRRGDTPPPGSRRESQGNVGTMDLAEGFDILDELETIATARGVSIAQVALNWVLNRPGVTSVLIGARNKEQLKENLDAASWALADGEIARLDRVSARPLPYPYWHQQRFNAPRMRYTLSGTGQQ